MTAWILFTAPVLLKRLIQRRVVDQVANLIIAGELHEGDTVLVDTDENGNLIARKK